MSRSFVLRLTAVGLIAVAAAFFMAGTALQARRANTLSPIPLNPRAEVHKPLHTEVAPTASIAHVVVKFKDDLAVRKSGETLFSKNGRSIKGAQQELAPYTGAARVSRLFDTFATDKLDRDRAALQLKSHQALADLNGYYKIDVTDPGEAQSLVNRLNALDEVEIAYVQPNPEPAGDIYPPTPDFQASQDYREAAPAGVDADYANTLPGGDGTGVKIIDVEGAWKDTHEDLDNAAGGLIGGPMIDDLSWRNHGTAVLGEMIAGDNGYGVTGICPGATAGMVSIGTISTAEALYTAADNLQQGDLILIELHAPGPHYNFEVRSDQLGYVCMEYWQANYDAIQYAWAKGVVVVEAGGNGSENFDDANLYGSLFDTTYRNSHAIIVGAGYPAASSYNLQKHGFSNYGARVNVQGYGSGVYTTGYGGLFDGGGDENQFYTASFSGTSSASPIITGTCACLQGYYKATYGAPMTSDQIRTVLVATGTPQLGDTSLHIGPRPNLAAAIATVTAPPSLYADPIYLDTTVDEGTVVTVSIALHNRSTTQALDFSINGNDSLAKMVPENWLTTSPTSGSIPVSGSMSIDVTLDGSLIPARIDPYTGVLEISWGPSGGSLDSMTVVPVFFDVACNDTTYAALATPDPGGPAYNWISARDSGVKINNNTFYGTGTDPLDDGTTGPWPLGFSFPFYGGSYTQVYIGANGGLSFTDTDLNVGGYYSGLTLPGAPFSTFLGVLWADLWIDAATVPDAGIYTWQNTAQDTLVIEWYRMANFNQAGDNTMDFEAILTADGAIKYQYRDIGTSGIAATALIGLSASGCQALSYYNNGDIPGHEISASEAVRFTEPGAPVFVQAGDVDNDGATNVSDLTYYVAFLFQGGPDPVPYQSGDLDCNGENNVSDLTYLIAFLFQGGPAPCYYQL